MNETNYLFLGGLFPKDKEKEILENSIGSVQNAANVFQWNIVNGLDANLPTPISILNALYIGAYPKRYKKLFIPSFEFSHTDNAHDYNVGFCNLTYVKHFFRKHNVNKQIKKWVESTSGKKVLFAYAMSGMTLSAIATAKRIDPTVTTCIIVPDLPQYMNMSPKQSLVYKILKRIDLNKQKKSLPYIDKYVLLTEQMKECLPVRDYTVVEAISSNNIVFEAKKRLQKTILYTGGLNAKYGVVDLIDAFMKIEDPEYRLILCGSGDAATYIKDMQKMDNRIVFKGLVSHSEVTELQSTATLLINPRKNNEIFTKYSFPSKNLEYLSSGAPVIAYKLDGIPDEYDEYINYVEDDSIEALKKKIIEVCSLSDNERNAMGKRAVDFVRNNKNAKTQAKKILELVK
ncbi:MAG: glycosyltransferase [Clostridia bacterium]|nr:glycosyltransferase [Clostridia bacterium]